MPTKDQIEVGTWGRFSCVKLECVVESEKRGKGAWRNAQEAKKEEWIRNLPCYSTGNRPAGYS